MQGNSRHGSSRSPSRGASPDTERMVGLLEPAVTAMGMDLEDVRITSAGRRRLLRVVVDRDGGISLDDIALVSRELSAALDRTAAMGEASYTLEVSSPGVARPLTEPKHWRRAIGRLVTAPLMESSRPATDGRSGSSAVTGRVAGADAQGVRLEVDGEGREFGYSQLGPGRIEIEFAPLDHGNRDNGADEEGPDGH